MIEGDHGSVLLHPEDAAARAAIACQAALQRRAGGDPEIRCRLSPLLRRAGFAEIEVRPRPIYADGSRPDLAEGFVRRTLATLVAGICDEAIRAGLADGPAFDAGLAALDRAAGPDGSFAYTFFEATALVPPS